MRASVSVAVATKAIIQKINPMSNTLPKLHSVQDAINQAGKSGYMFQDGFFMGIGRDGLVEFDHGDKLFLATPEQIFTDPLFWQLLGKARGWGKYHLKDGTELEAEKWVAYADRWFETRMNNGSESDFWQSLP